MVIDYTPYLACSDPYAHRSVMTAIVKVESGGNPWAININSKNGQRLLYPAKSLEQAQAWVRWFVANNYNIDIGIAQINIKNIQKQGLNPVSFLEPCTNLKMAGQILKANYVSASKNSTSSDDAVKKAISAYNTGNYRSGFTNGYVGKVMAKYYGQPIQKNVSYAMTPPITTGNGKIINNSNSNNGNGVKKIYPKDSDTVGNNLQLAQNNQPQKKNNFFTQPGIKVDLWSSRGGQNN